MAHVLQGQRPSLGPTAAGTPPQRRWRIDFETTGLDLVVEVDGARLRDDEWDFAESHVVLEDAVALTPESTVSVYRDTPIDRVTTFEDAAYVRGPAGEAAFGRVHTLIEELAAELTRVDAELAGRGIANRLPPDAITGVRFDQQSRSMRFTRSRGPSFDVPLDSLVTIVGGVPFTATLAAAIAANTANVAIALSASHISRTYESIGDVNRFSAAEKARLDALHDDVDFNADRTAITNIDLQPSEIRRLYRDGGTDYLGRKADDRRKLDSVPDPTGPAPQLATEEWVSDEVRTTVGLGSVLFRRAVMEGILTESTAHQYTNEPFQAGVPKDTGVEVTTGTIIGLESQTAGGPQLDHIALWADDVLALPAVAAGVGIPPASGFTFRRSQYGTFESDTIRIGRTSANHLLVEL